MTASAGSFVAATRCDALYDIPATLPFTPCAGLGIGGQALEFDGPNSSMSGPASR